MDFECDELMEMPDQKGKGKCIEGLKPTQYAYGNLKRNSAHLE